MIQIGDNFVDPKTIEAVLADDPSIDAKGAAVLSNREFEAQPLSIVWLKNGASFKDKQTPEQINAQVDKALAETVTEPTSGEEALTSIHKTLEEGLKTLTKISESAQYIAEMHARMVMYVTDGHGHERLGPG